METVRQRDQQWLQVVHQGVTVEYLTLDSAKALLERAGVDWATLVEVAPRDARH